MHLLRYLTILLVFFSIGVQSQTPFVCKGDYYLTLRSRTGTHNDLYTVEIDPNSNLVTFDEVPNFQDDYDLNAMGYRSTDNFIYIINLVDNGLMRISADGQVTPLRVLSELPNLRYFAGACTPDGKYLVISGSPFDFGFGSVNTNLIFIDLTDPTYPTREVKMRNNPYLFFDMDFDPFTGICYAYDSNEQTLIKVDVDRGTTSPVGRGRQPSNTMGGLFFDAFGNLFGYGRPDNGNDQNTLYKISTSTGALTVMSTGEAADRSDGCSCPYTVKLDKSVNPRIAARCSEVIYTFVIANASATERVGIEFYDPMPIGFEILEIISNPFGGFQVDTGEPNVLHIKDMMVPLGVDSILVRVRIGDGLAGRYENQARLDGLPLSLGGFVLSDDPSTLRYEDPTVLNVFPLSVDLQSQNQLLCFGDSLYLTGSQPGAEYLWHDGSTNIGYWVTEPGRYFVEARTACEVVSDTVTIEFSPPLSVEIGEDREVALGDSFNIEPFVMGLGPFDYLWSEHDEVETISCVTCPNTSITPFFDTRYVLEVTDGAGCVQADFIDVMVDRNVYVWIPNAFTPNGDGKNDYFYLLGKVPYDIKTFEIYNRWGQILFQNQGIEVNSEFDGWDGNTDGRPLSPGVYVYRAVLNFIDGSTKDFYGDVTLVK